jgi:hypothetical protein
MTAQETTRGRCLCGGVTFEAPKIGRITAHCHCTFCRRASGAPVVTWVCHKIGTVRVLSGDDLIRTYESSPGTFRKFCGRCGTALFFESVNWPGETHVTRVSLDDDAGPAPSRHVFYADRARFFDDAETLPKS